jgi:hypothetical protein
MYRPQVAQMFADEGSSVGYRMPKYFSAVICVICGKRSRVCCNTIAAVKY